MADEELHDQDLNEDAEAVEIENEEDESSLEDKLKEAIDVRVEEVGTLRKKLTVTVPRESVDERLNDQYDELRRDAQVPGFRRGRAPRRLLEKRFGDEISDTLVQQLVGTSYQAALDKVDLKVLGEPLVWAREKDAESESLLEVDKAMGLIELPEDGPLVYACEVEVRPEFELPELEGIKLEKPAMTISDEQVDKQIEYLRGMRGTYEPVIDDGAKADDVVYVDIKMTSGDTVLKEQENARFAVRGQNIDGVVLENLGEVLAGARVGETRTTSGTISDDYYKIEFRGKPVEFSFKIRGIERQKLPELDEDFVKSFGAENLDELKKWIRDDLESRVGEQMHRALSGQVCQYLLDNTQFDLPERLNDRQTQRVVVRRMIDLYQQGIPPAQVEKLMDEVKTSAQRDATRDLKLALIMEKLDEEFEASVTEEEINARIAAIAQRQGRRFDRVRDELIKGEGLTNLFMQVRDEKIVDQLIAQAVIAETEASAEKAGNKSSDSSPKNDSGAAQDEDKDAGDLAEET